MTAQYQIFLHTDMALEQRGCVGWVVGGCALGSSPHPLWLALCLSPRVPCSGVWCDPGGGGFPFEHE
jgi:hypothetical protein